MTTTYNDFLKGKRISIESSGFDATDISDHLFDFQRDIVKLAVKKGKCAVFAGTGLGKRVAAAVNLVADSHENWIIWCDLNAESEAITKAIDDAVEIKGAHDREYKTEKMAASWWLVTTQVL